MLDLMRLEYESKSCAIMVYLLVSNKVKTPAFQAGSFSYFFHRERARERERKRVSLTGLA